MKSLGLQANFRLVVLESNLRGIGQTLMHNRFNNFQRRHSNTVDMKLLDLYEHELISGITRSSADGFEVYDPLIPLGIITDAIEVRDYYLYN